MRSVAPIRFTADGAWREYSLPLVAPGTLAILSLHFEKTPGVCEFEWIRLDRRKGNAYQRAAEWNFRAG